MFTTRRITTMGGDKFRDEFSLAFDGTDDYIQTGFVPDYTSITGVAWVKVTSETANTKTIFSARDDTANGFLFYVSGAENVTVKLNTNGLASTAGALVLNSWYHVAFTYDGSTTTIYVNGVGNSEAESSTHNMSQNMTIGMDSYTAQYPAPINISEVAVYNTALSASQIKTLYNGREPYNHKEGIASGNLKAWYRMGDGLENHSGTTIYDMSNNTNNGTMLNMSADDFEGDTP